VLTLAGVLALCAAGALAHSGSPGARERGQGEPVALLLAPLGPAKALLSSALWVAVWNEQHDGDPELLVPLSRALLELHPGLDHVRRFLAEQLIVTEAPRATDPERHDALVHAGLELLEQGRLRSDSALLHQALGRLLYLQPGHDPTFAHAAEGFFGGSLLDVAIEALARSPEPQIDGRLAAELLVERGLAALEEGEAHDARADLAEADAALEPARQSARGTAGVEDAALDAILQPLRDALAAAAAAGAAGAEPR
jgi:hypothetical protein